MDAPPPAAMRFVPAGAFLAGLLVLPDLALPQSLAAPMAADTVVVEAGTTGFVPAVSLGTGESVVVWVEADVEVGAWDVGGRPVPDAEAGAVIARFGGSPPFAWPVEPTVWTAPGPGVLAFGLNGHVGHRMRGRARMVVAPLAAARAGFARPGIELRRVEGGVRVRWADRAGFGIDRRTLSFTLTTARGTVYELGPWGPVGDREAVLPLPPPVDLPAGIHTLSATIVDRLGNRAPPATVAFDSGG